MNQNSECESMGNHCYGGVGTNHCLGNEFQLDPSRLLLQNVYRESIKAKWGVSGNGYCFRADACVLCLGTKQRWQLVTPSPYVMSTVAETAKWQIVIILPVVSIGSPLVIHRRHPAVIHCAIASPHTYIYLFWLSSLIITLKCTCYSITISSLNLKAVRLISGRSRMSRRGGVPTS